MDCFTKIGRFLRVKLGLRSAMPEKGVDTRLEYQVRSDSAALPPISTGLHFCVAHDPACTRSSAPLVSLCDNLFSSPKDSNHSEMPMFQRIEEDG
jgi:hypothetical protein